MNDKQNLKLLYLNKLDKIKVSANKKESISLMTYKNELLDFNISDNNEVYLKGGFKDDTVYILSIKDDLSFVDYPNTKELIIKTNKENKKELPTYWTKYLEEIIKQVNNTKYNKSFIYFTDSHITYNQMYFPSIIKYIKDHTNIDTTLFGGDIIGEYYAYADAYKELLTFKEMTSDLNIVSIMGNHDNNCNYVGDDSDLITKEEYYDLMYSDRKDIYLEKNHLFGYYDDHKNKIRFVLLDTGIKKSNDLNEEQIKYIKEYIKDAKEDYNVILLAHKMFGGNPIGSTNLNLILLDDGKIIKELIDDVDDKRFIACLSGHCHMNCIIDTDKGFKMISSSCDGGGENCLYDLPFPYRNVGTVEEQAIDIFLLDEEDRKISIIRVGAGLEKANRIINY